MARVYAAIEPIATRSLFASVHSTITDPATVNDSVVTTQTSA